jgi:hypothetical protein
MAASPPQLEERRRKRSPSTRPPWSRRSLRNRAAVFTCRARELQNAILEKREIKDDATPPAAGELRLAWPALAGRVILAASIGQPSGEGRIASATLVAADAAATPATPDFCKSARQHRADRSGGAVDQFRDQPAGRLEPQSGAVLRLQWHADYGPCPLARCRTRRSAAARARRRERIRAIRLPHLRQTASASSASMTRCC